jgi:hypothetical protein
MLRAAASRTCQMMRKLSTSAVLLALTLLTGAPVRSAEDDAAVQKRMDEFVAAWNKNDAKAMGSAWIRSAWRLETAGLRASRPIEP